MEDLTCSKYLVGYGRSFLNHQSHRSSFIFDSFASNTLRCISVSTTIRRSPRPRESRREAPSATLPAGTTMTPTGRRRSREVAAAVRASGTQPTTVVCRWGTRHCAGARRRQVLLRNGVPSLSIEQLPTKDSGVSATHTHTENTHKNIHPCIAIDTSRYLLLLNILLFKRSNVYRSSPLISHQCLPQQLCRLCPTIIVRKFSELFDKYE